MVPGHDRVRRAVARAGRRRAAGRGGSRGAAGRSRCRVPAAVAGAARSGSTSSTWPTSRHGRRSLRRRGGGRRRAPPDADRAEGRRARPPWPSGSPASCPTSPSRSRSSSPRSTRWPASSTRRRMLTRPPFSAPHHDASKASMLGGGTGRCGPARSAGPTAGCCSSTSSRCSTADIDRGAAAAARERGGHDRPGRRDGDLPGPRHVRASPPTRARAATTIRRRPRERPVLVPGGPAPRLPQQAQRPDHRPDRHHPARASRCRQASCATRWRRPPRPAPRSGRGSRRPGSARPSATPTSPGGSTPRRPGPLLRERWPLTDGRSQAVDTELYAGRLTRRGATRVHRLAWTVADLRGVDRPGRRRGRRRAAAAHRRAAAAVDARRGARPDEPRRRAAGPGGALPARRAGRPAAGRPGRRAGRASGVHDHLADRTGRRRAAHRRGRPPRPGSTRGASSAGAAQAGIRFVIPGDAEWPTQLDDLARRHRSSDRGGVPLGLWVRGPLRLDELAESGRGGRVPLGHHLRRRRGCRASPRPWPRPGGAWSRVRRSGSTRPPTGGRWPAAARRSRCWPAAPTASTRPRTSS